MSNSNEVEKEAMKWVMKYETSEGRQPIDVSGDEEHEGYDIKSGHLEIEVKGRGGDKPPHVLLNEYNIDGLLNSNEENYRLYIVLNPEKNPKLVVLSRSEVMSRKKTEEQWKIPLRVVDINGAKNLIPLKNINLKK